METIKCSAFSFRGVISFEIRLAKSEENLEVAKKENAVILLEEDYSTKYEGYNPNSPNSFILFSLLQNIHWKQSLNFADYVQKELGTTTKQPNRGVKQAGFLVLWRTTVPSVLIETGFLSNENDRKILISEEGKNSIAYAIFKAFRNYKSDIENRSIYTNNDRGADTLLALPTPDTLSSVTDTIYNVSANTDVKSVNVSEIIFLVQIFSSKKPIPLNSSHFKGLRNVEELKVGDSYKYVVGRKTSFKEVVAYTKIVKNYFPDAFVVALRDDKIIPLKEALKEIKD